MATRPVLLTVRRTYCISMLQWVNVHSRVAVRVRLRQTVPSALCCGKAHAHRDVVSSRSRRRFWLPCGGGEHERMPGDLLVTPPLAVPCQQSDELQNRDRVQPARVRPLDGATCEKARNSSTGSMARTTESPSPDTGRVMRRCAWSTADSDVAAARPAGLRALAP